ncbi:MULTISPECIES: hypothetical protein [Pseudomonas]|uniref:hypothetical protein n=1 Tax=Pseudomonas TaxID=286 RepID=UPI000F57B416|nr:MULTISPECIES: hypothetical protein [Pseudomonas]KAB0531346.1 hypothetical protein F7R16_16160 [Pseudomonas chlororaphis subsp. aureofaciens]TSD32330.1 hypothetical protein FCE86_023055 [Pseudomonas sp. ATCC 13985]WDG62904.1 hypothetical protein PUP52_13485 [Pseudomonas chlororaphis]WDG69171.1 hypothetical protein PUP59_13785 [Pseudomonas chlororaphis]
MKKKILGVFGLSLLTLSGCEIAAAFSVFSVPSDDPLVIKMLPAVRQVCPGLDKYSQEFERVRVEENFRTSILFDVPESASIPDAYKAGGHTCYIEIDSKGRSIFIEKLACKSICLDQLETPDGQLKIDLPQASG